MIELQKAFGNNADSFPEPPLLIKGDGQGVGRDSEIRRVDDRKINIDVAHGLPDHTRRISVFQDEGDMGFFRVQAAAVSVVAPLSELLTVIRNDNDKGILVKVAAAQFFKKLADLAVGEPDSPVIEIKFLLDVRRGPAFPEWFLKETAVRWERFIRFVGIHVVEIEEKRGLLFLQLRQNPCGGLRYGIGRAWCHGDVYVDIESLGGFRKDIAK